MDDTTELTLPPDHPLVVIQAAISSGADPQSLEKLMDLQERWEDRNAKGAFNRAMMQFQSQMPAIYKSRNNKGTNSLYASYDDIMRVARPVLEDNGLAVSFSQVENGSMITVTCRLMHVEGHSEETPFTLPKDGPITNGGGRNVTNLAQAQGSANSYAKRYCLCNALNIVLGDQDDDAKAMDIPVETVSEIQAEELGQLITDAEVDEGKFLEFFRASSPEDIALVRFAEAKTKLQARIAQNRKQADND